MHPVELHGARVALREFGPDDLEGIRAYASDPEVRRHATHLARQDADTVEWLKHVVEEAHADPRTSYDLAVTVRDDVVGSAGVARFGGPGDWSLGYVIRRDRWGKGLATDAARTIVGFAFAHLRANRVFAMCDPRNAASWRVMEKCFMRREGLHLRHHDAAGEWRSNYQYAVLGGEWAALQAFPPRALSATGRRLSIERPSGAAIAEIHELMRVVGQDMLERFGMDHWREPFPLEQMRADARRRETYAVRADDCSIVGSFTIGVTPQWLNEETLPWSKAALPLWLHRLMVHPSLQRDGLGTLLMRTAEDLARARGCDAIRLETRTDFTEIQGFYERLGYAERYREPASKNWSSWNALEKALDVSG